MKNVTLNFAFAPASPRWIVPREQPRNALSI
jgi:hypothetical protein